MPSIINATTSTGLVTTADNSGSLQLATNNGTTAVTIDTSQRVGIGATSPTNLLQVASTTSDPYILIGGTAARDCGIKLNATNEFTALRADGANRLFVNCGSEMRFTTADTERMRINSTGVVGIGQDPNTYGQFVVKFDATTSPNNFLGIGIVPAANTSNANFLQFYTAGGNSCGNVTRNGTSNSVLYNTSSDYRLKENINPMTGALAKVQLLKPVTWTWKDGGQSGEGFIAHEVQEVVPSAVSGDKDAIDANGKPNYQGMDASYLVATLTAAIQELKAELDATKAEVAALKGAQ